MEYKRILVGGGARSGKSRFALDLARRLGERRWFVATAVPLDAEMRRRIDRHRNDRSDDFTTIEEPVDLSPALDGIRDADIVLVDCVTLWLSNLLIRGEAEDGIDGRLDALIETVRRVPFHLILVTNEVGMGVVPESSLGRLFRDVCGRAHQRLGEAMNEVYVAILGTILRLRPGVVEVQSWEHES